MRLPTFFEEYIPYLVAVPIGLTVFAHPFHIPAARVGDFVNSSLTVSALLLGFLATSKSILISYRGSRVFSQLKNSGHIKKMIGYLMLAIFSSLLWLIISFSMYFVLSGLTLAVWCFLASLSLTSFIRVVLLQSKLISV
jgi:hypothetical protein